MISHNGLVYGNGLFRGFDSRSLACPHRAKKLLTLNQQA